MTKNPIYAFLLAFFPGGGLFYLKKPLRAIFYLCSAFGLPIASIILADLFNSHFFYGFAIGGLMIYTISFLDTIITASKLYKQTGEGSGLIGETSVSNNSERFFTIVLSFIPGVGHFQLGLMNRGISILTTFLGLGTMVLFVTILSSRLEFLIFLAILPVIWVIGFFDAMQQLNDKQRGEKLVDRTIFEDFDSRREEGRKSKAIAIFLSIFPGAGHLYLGLQHRGIQLMAAFLFSIYILDILRLGMFFFLIPLIWFYSFFDGMQKASKYGLEPLEDTAIISYLFNYQRWIGAGLIFIGFYYAVVYLPLPLLSRVLGNWFNGDALYMFSQYFQTGIVCLLFIGGGVKLLFSSRKKRV
nr:hypothetical protein [uncultured Bacillus sp.]